MALKFPAESQTDNFPFEIPHTDFHPECESLQNLISAWKLIPWSMIYAAIVLSNSVNNQLCTNKY
jgi:hypothetical protein